MRPERRDREDPVSTLRGWGGRDAGALYLYGRILANTKNPDAEKTLLAALEVDPTYPWAHLALARFYEDARADATKAQAHLAAAIDQCPNSILILGRLGDLSSAQIARRAEVVRAQLAKEAEPALATQLQAIWAAEFKTVPPGQRATVRERMRHDLALLRGTGEVQDRRVLDALLAGYRMDGDDSGLDWAIGETARRFPDDGEARRATFERFRARHRQPEGCDPSAMQAYDRALAEASKRWVELWPQDPSTRYARLDGLAGSPDTTMEDLNAAIDAFLAVAAARPSETPSRPSSFAAASALLESGRALDRVPGLIDQGLAEIRSRTPDAAKDTERPNEERARIAEGFALLVNVQLRQDAIDAARATFATLIVAAPPERENRVRDPKDEARLREYRAIQEVVSASTQCGFDPEAARRITEILAPDVAVLEAAQRASMPERPSMIDRSFSEVKSLPLPDFELQDLSGRTWRSSDLRGKVVLIHVWMDMPYSHEMLPWLEELKGRLANRSDVAILTINADENPGPIAPLMRDNGYTFPVVFSRPLATQLGGGRLSLPNTWIVDRQGTVCREDNGLVPGGRAQWLDKVVRVIDEVGASAPAKP